MAQIYRIVSIAAFSLAGVSLVLAVILGEISDMEGYQRSERTHGKEIHRADARGK